MNDWPFIRQYLQALAPKYPTVLDAIAEVERLAGLLHNRQNHPDYEYATTDGPRKNFDEDEPEGDGWVRNVHIGRNGWERFDYHEEAYWMRIKAAFTEKEQSHE